MAGYKDLKQAVEHEHWMYLESGDYIGLQYSNYSSSCGSSGAIFLKLLRKYQDRFQSFPDEEMAEILRDKAYEKWKELYCK